jgi:hypothetical protein
MYLYANINILIYNVSRQRSREDGRYHPGSVTTSRDGMVWCYKKFP